MSNTKILAVGGTFTVTYRPTKYGKPVTRRLVLQQQLHSTYTGMNYFFAGPRGGKVAMVASDIVAVAL